jgi:WD40 repeat protein/serine/threonine protein kinase
MVSQPYQCDRNRLRLSLEDQLSEAEQAALASHLESCPACRQELERMAAASQFWGDAHLLRGELAAGASSTVCPAAERVDLPEEEDETGERDSDWLGFLDPPHPDQPETIGWLGPYEVIEFLGRGGMGVVLKARDPALDRTVAIKVLMPVLAHRATARRRFAREARAAAAVGHEHIVAIHAVDEFRGLPYIVMQYVPGRSLQERLDASGMLEVKELLRIGTQAARALAAAHAQGVVHRDIKPANILLENCIERVKLTDFGLARAVGDASLTQSGVIAGTPQYMAPEQARGEPVDARADLFALGAVLYAMAAGRPPFRADSALAVLKRVCEVRHRPIRELNPDVPDWLEAVIDRLLAKDPADRFQSAAIVADVLERGLAHVQQPTAVPRPVVPGAASPSAPAYEFDLLAPKSPPRRRRVLELAAGLILLAMAGLGVTEAAGLTQVSDFVATILRIKTPEGTLVVKVLDPGVKIQIDDDDLVISGAGPHEIRLRAGQHRVQATKDGRPVDDKLVTITRGGKEIVNVGFEAGERTLDTAKILPQGPRTPVPPSPDGWMATAHARTFESIGRRQDHPARGRALIWSLAFAPDGRRLAIGQQGIDGRDSILRVWDLEQRWDVILLQHSAPYRSVAFSPSGGVLAAGCLDGTLQLVRFEDDIAHTTHSSTDQGSSINAVAFLPDGKTVAAGDWAGTVRFHNVETTKERRPLKYPDRIYSIDVSPDGATIAVAGQANSIFLYDLATGRLKATLSGHEGAVESVAFSPDGKLLASASWDRTVRLWSAETGKILVVLRGHSHQVLSARFSPDGKLLATADGQWDVPHEKNLPGEIKLWDVASHREVRSLRGHVSSIYALAFSPDGKTLASGSTDQTVKLWDTASGELRETIVPGESGASSGMGAGFSRASEAVRATMNSFPERTVRKDRENETPPRPKVILPHGSNIEVWSAAYSPDGKTLITGTSGGALLRWDVEKLPGGGRPLDGSFSPVSKIAFAPDGKIFATANWDHSLNLWDADGSVLAVLKGHRASVLSVAFSPDGELMASASRDKTTKIWDMVERREIRTIPAQGEPVNAVAFSPDGKLLATGSGDWRIDKPGEVELWDPATGSHVGNAWHSPRDVKDLAFSPDGKHLAVAHAASREPGGDGAVAILSVGLRPGPVTILSCPTGATAVAFSPDGSLLAVGERNGTLRLLDIRTLSQHHSPAMPIHSAKIFDLAFSPDGKTLASASMDGTVKIWDVGALNRVSRGAEPKLGP